MVVNLLPSGAEAGRFLLPCTWCRRLLQCMGDGADAFHALGVNNVSGEEEEALVQRLQQEAEAAVPASSGLSKVAVARDFWVQILDKHDGPAPRHRVPSAVSTSQRSLLSPKGAL